MNQNELVKEICEREQGKGKGLNASQVKTVLRYFSDIELEQRAKVYGVKPHEVLLGKLTRTPFSNLISSASRRAKKKEKK